MPWASPWQVQGRAGIDQVNVPVLLWGCAVCLCQAVVKRIELPILFLLLKMRKNSIFLSCQTFWPCRRQECVHSQGLEACTISPAQLGCCEGKKYLLFCCSESSLIIQDGGMVLEVLIFFFLGGEVFPIIASYIYG